MCTVGLCYRVFEQAPVVVAANRDEALDRPSAGPQWWSPEDGVPFFAPKDEVAGGTWIGLNTHGVFVGITNRFMAPSVPQRTSRGVLVTRALSALTAQLAAERVLQWDPEDINPFHVLIADPHTAHMLWHDGQVIHERVLAPGIHVITEQSFEAGDPTRERFVAGQLQGILSHGAPEPEALSQLLATGHGRGFADVRVSLPEYNYGTRSSMLIMSNGAHADVLSEDDGGFAPGSSGQAYTLDLMARRAP